MPKKKMRPRGFNSQRDFFSKSKLPCSKILLLGYLWLSKVHISAIISLTGVSFHTACDFGNHYRGLVGDSLDECDWVIGGKDIIVEVDETKMGKRKYYRGHRVDGVWIFGGIERTDARKIFFAHVEDRSAATLLALIKKHIRPGSIIYSDLWRGYLGLRDMDEYQHSTVNYSQCFVDPSTGVHTNGIEGVWNGLKLRVPPRNRVADGIDEHLWENIWRKKNEGNLWKALIESLREVHYD